jgi:hypothetical protein
MAGLAGVNIPNDARFANMNAANDLALISVVQIARAHGPILLTSNLFTANLVPRLRVPPTKSNYNLTLSPVVDH